MNTFDEATSFPRGDLQLAVCRQCGFIANTLWDETLVAYANSYEETQHFSDTFHRFATELAQRWIDEYDIRGKRVLEIGCGKGEFLALLCELGDNRGIGVDPSVIPKRIPAHTRNRIEFIPEYYTAAHARLDADVICCRHTLEHIAATAGFVDQLRRSIGDRRDVTVLFELPDVTRVLRETAFWDIYYEHCSYFTAGSLARLFRAASFDVIDIDRVYGDQYLILAATPTTGPTPPRLQIEHDLDDTLRDVDDFADRHPRSIAVWRARLGELSGGGKKVALWGAGSKCVSFCATLPASDQIACVIDINPHKQGKFLPGTGHRVVSPEDLRSDPPDVVVPMNSIYSTEIANELDRLGVSAQLLALESLDGGV
ncbi:MAG: class I SAM-dependent methyltransferase [Pirellulaceae bacterium]|jgi:SAM-dependent methyltransferase|nr:class I SAM-dependent methyltransferase [Pirellulaceae bacterium]